MTRIIGITGKMGTGKTTLANVLVQKMTEKYIHLDLDIFRRKLFQDSDIAKNIYHSPKKMRSYKTTLYKALKDYLNNNSQNIIISWALIIEDDLMGLFDRLIIITCTRKTIYKRLADSNLTKKEIDKRLGLQMSLKEKKAVLKSMKNKTLTINSDKKYDIDKIIKFIKEGDDNEMYVYSE